jgi:hypothetical protein
MNYDMVAYMAIMTIMRTLLDFSVRVPDIHRVDVGNSKLFMLSILVHRQDRWPTSYIG